MATLQVVDFPFERLPDCYVPQSTILRLSESGQAHPYLWCYLDRGKSKSSTEFNPSSLSQARVSVLPHVIERLSKWCRFQAAKASSIERRFSCLSQFLSWADLPEHNRTFERVLCDPELALLALHQHHTFIRQRLQSHQINQRTAAALDQGVVRILSEVYGRTYMDEIEPLSTTNRGLGTVAPDDREVASFLSTLQAIFDSAVRMIIHAGDGSEGTELNPVGRVVRLSSTDDTRTAILAEGYSGTRLMELACVAFAGIALADSGANLAQIQSFEVPDDLHDQLISPDRVNLAFKAIKFRAGGKTVPIHFTSAVMSRLGAYLRMRRCLMACMGSEDSPMLFMQCEFKHGAREPVAVRRIGDDFLKQLRNKVRIVGGELPPITLRQLRAYKQVHVVRKHGVKVSADIMGHSVATAIRAYCNAQESVRESEMGHFLKSLTTTIVAVRKSHSVGSVTVGIAVGSCAGYGQPKPIDTQAVVEPDCDKSEGCFFCGQYRVHADETDLRKLLSCRNVLRRLAPLQGAAVAADRVYVAVIDRIDMLLAELSRSNPQEYKRIEWNVDGEGDLNRYWAVKLQQLHLLGALDQGLAA
ncbi:MAG: hypothetical protein EOP36_02980 [Rubrivivax sp.]|nr:MAG: hypothetical protein EOP36_02980 [Rubrivivax sp.]